MPADRLTILPAQPVADAVRAVLAGGGLAAAAARAGLDAADLEDAVLVYHTAGTAALDQRAASRWYNVRIRFTNWDTSEHAMTAGLGPRLDALETGGAMARWWFLRKHPHWRIRLLDAATPAVDRLLGELTESGTIAGWQQAVYEPETAAFGGPVGMDIAHELFCADSRGVLHYLRHSRQPLGRRELSVLLLSAMTAAAGLDWFERGDVFARVAAMRPALPDDRAGRAHQLTAQLRALLTVPATPGSPLFATSGPAASAAPWLAAFETAGRCFSDAAARGALGRGLRAVLAQTVIFHWNRLGLPATTQAILACAAATACLPG